jgi:hypothetical protein
MTLRQSDRHKMKKKIMAIIFAYWPAFWLFPWLFDRKCQKAALELLQRYLRRNP